MNIEEIKAKVLDLKQSYKQISNEESVLRKERKDIITMLDINDDLKNKRAIIKNVVRKTLAILVIFLIAFNTILAAGLIVLITSLYFKNKRQNFIRKDSLFYEKLGYLPDALLLLKSQNGLKSDFDYINGLLYNKTEAKQEVTLQLQTIFEKCLEAYTCNREKAIETRKIIDDIGNVLGYEEASNIIYDEQKSKR